MSDRLYPLEPVPIPSMFITTGDSEGIVLSFKNAQETIDDLESKKLNLEILYRTLNCDNIFHYDCFVKHPKLGLMYVTKENQDISEKVNLSGAEFTVIPPDNTCTIAQSVDYIGNIRFQSADPTKPVLLTQFGNVIMSTMNSSFTWSNKVLLPNHCFDFVNVRKITCTGYVDVSKYTRKYKTEKIGVSYTVDAVDGVASIRPHIDNGMPVHHALYDVVFKKHDLWTRVHLCDDTETILTSTHLCKLLGSTFLTSERIMRQLCEGKLVVKNVESVSYKLIVDSVSVENIHTKPPNITWTFDDNNGNTKIIVSHDNLLWFQTDNNTRTLSDVLTDEFELDI